MNQVQRETPAPGKIRTVALAVLRALRSMVVIGLVVLVVVASREPNFRWQRVWRLAAANIHFLVLLFFAVLIGDFWVGLVRTKQARRQRDLGDE